MEALWFGIVAVLFAVYTILDGFDLGAGAIYLFLARTESERRSVLAAVGPFWDGNEFWLLLAGAALYCGFPAVYGSRGFYLAAIVLVWLLILRGIAMEFRTRVESARARQALDIVFGVGSILLAFSLGTAVGFLLSGTLNWFAVFCGVCGLAVVTLQSAAWMALKSTGELQLRCRSLASGVWWLMLIGYAVLAAAALLAQPVILDSTLVCAFAVMTLAGMIGTRLSLSVGFDLGAFASAACVIAGLLFSALAGFYPNVSHSLTAPYQMSASAIWWIPAFLLAAGYNVRKHRFLQIPSESRALARGMRDIAIH